MELVQEAQQLLPEEPLAVEVVREAWVLPLLTRQLRAVMVVSLT